VLDHLNEQLGRFELAAQRRGYRPDDRFEHLGQPPVRGLLLVVEVASGAVRVEVVEQLAGLVLLGVQAGQAQQPPAAGCASRRTRVAPPPRASP